VSTLFLHKLCNETMACREAAKLPGDWANSRQDWRCQQPAVLDDSPRCHTRHTVRAVQLSPARHTDCTPNSIFMQGCTQLHTPCWVQHQVQHHARRGASVEGRTRQVVCLPTEEEHRKGAALYFLASAGGAHRCTTQHELRHHHKTRTCNLTRTHRQWSRRRTAAMLPHSGCTSRATAWRQQIAAKRLVRVEPRGASEAQPAAGPAMIQLEEPSVTCHHQVHCCWFNAAR
jgi:hypothetical protein